MHRFISSTDFQPQDTFDPNLKLSNHLKKLQLSQTQNKHQLSNLPSSKDRQTISSFIKQQIKTLFSIHFHEFQQQFKCMKDNLECQQKNTQSLMNEMNVLKTNLIQNIQNPSPKPLLNTKTSTSSQGKTSSDIKFLHLENELNLISSKQQEINKTNQSENKNIERMKEAISHEIVLMNNELKLQIAHLRDSVADIEEVYKYKYEKFEMENNNILNQIQESIDDLSVKYRNNNEQTIKIFTQLQKYNLSIQINCNRIEKAQKYIKQMDIDYDLKLQSLKKTNDIRFSQIQELFQLSLQRIVIPYNSNFQQVDKNVNELKQIIKDVLKFTKILGDKLVVKLNNTIDNATFQKTIENINESFNETYMLNIQKIKELNEKEYEVYHELNHVKNVLEDLKVEYQSSKKLDREDVFEKRITSLGDLDLGIDSDGEESAQGTRGKRGERRRTLKGECGLFEQQETQDPDINSFSNNPFRRKTERELEHEFDD